MAKKKEAEQTTEVAAATAAQVPAAMTAGDLKAWGVEGLTQRDIVIPKILAMQGLSKLVTSGQAKFGEFRDSLNGVVLGEIGKQAIEFVPFLLEKVWIVFEDKNPPGSQQTNYKFTKVEPLTAENENWPYEEVINGVKIRRDRTMNFYVLLPGEIEKGGAIPYILSFRRTSARAGQKLATTMFMKNLKAGKTPASMVLELHGEKQQNDKGTFVVLDVKEKRPSTTAEIAEAFSWVKTVKAGKTRADTSDLEAEAAIIQEGETVQKDF